MATRQNNTQPDSRAALARRRENGGQADNTLANDIRKMQAQYQLAMPKGAEAEQLVRDALTALRTTRNLDKCDSASVLGGLMTCAQLGLRPGVLGHAWLLPFWSGKDRGFKAQLVIGYQGLIELAHRSGQISSLYARTVFTNDEFDVDYGIANNLVHKPNLVEDRGEPLAYYAVAKFTNGGYAFYVMTHRETLSYRDQYATAKNREGKVFGPWVDNFEGMAHKGLALDTPIPTNSGWSTMGDLRVGDRLFDMHGKPTTVRAISEIKHIDCYRVTFSNGASITCDGEHIWVASIGPNSARTVTTKGWDSYEITDLYAAKREGQAVVVPVIGALDTPDANLPVDPWMLGYWLGDGTSVNASVASHADQLEDLKAAIAASGYTVGSVRPDARSTSAVQVGIRGGLAKDLADLGVLGHKHVPAQYMRASASQRLSLLQGLIDSDGHIDARRGRVRFVNTDKGLTDAVAELARSLGEVVHRVERNAVGYGKTVRVYEAAWMPTMCPATFTTKAARFRVRQIAPYRSIKSIERVETVPTQCIAVDSPTRTYAAGVEMIPTHNTCVRQLAKFMPKSTELAQALEADDAVRINVNPQVDPGEAADHDVIDSEVVEDSADPNQTAAAGQSEPATPPPAAVQDPAVPGEDWPATARPGGAA